MVRVGCESGAALGMWPVVKVPGAGLDIVSSIRCWALVPGTCKIMEMVRHRRLDAVVVGIPLKCMHSGASSV